MNVREYGIHIKAMIALLHIYRGGRLLRGGIAKNRFTHENFGGMLSKLGGWNDAQTDQKRELGRRWLKKPTWDTSKFTENSVKDLTRSIARVFAFCCPTVEMVSLCETLCAAADTRFVREEVSIGSFDLIDLSKDLPPMKTGQISFADILEMSKSELAIAQYAYDGAVTTDCLNLIGFDLINRLVIPDLNVWPGINILMEIRDQENQDTNSRTRKLAARPNWQYRYRNRVDLELSVARWCSLGRNTVFKEYLEAAVENVFLNTDKVIPSKTDLLHLIADG